jgi:hypothetical protein
MDGMLIFWGFAVLVVSGGIWLFCKTKPRSCIIAEPILYAKKGEIISCTGGHEICELAKDVYVGGTLVADKFTNWRNQEPAKPHDVVAPCKTCGAPFIKQMSHHGGSQLHIDREWRTTRPPPTYG